jgi:hypothetical protein
MKDMKVRLAKPEDAKLCAEWAVSAGNPISTALGYPSVITVAVDEEEEPVLFQTAYPVLLLEALVVKPDASNEQHARGIKALYDYMKGLSKQFGLAEMYFFTKSAPMMAMVTKHNMFEKVQLDGYRCKV